MLETGIDYQGRRTVRTLGEVGYNDYIRCPLEAEIVLKGPCVDGKDEGKWGEGKMHFGQLPRGPKRRGLCCSPMDFTSGS